MIRAFFSYVLYVFFVFIALSLLVSETMQSFSQLFALLSRDGMFFSFVIKFLCCWIWIISFFYLYFSYQMEKQNFSKSLVAVLVAIIFLFIWLYLVSTSEKNYIDTLHFNFYEIGYLDFFSLIWINIKEVLFSSFFYLFLLLLPSLFLIFNCYFDIKKTFHRFAVNFFPSINVCIMVLVASAFQPYYDRPNVFLYLDFLFFFIAFLCIFILFYKKKFLFHFYEYANLLLLITMIFVILTCSDIMVKADYFNVRYCLYLIAFLTWCCEWMFNDLLEK